MRSFEFPTPGKSAKYDGTMYRVVTDIDSRYESLEECKKNAYSLIVPSVPCTAGPPEDTTIPRICVAPSIEACITAIGLLGRFRRCLERNKDAFQYSTIGRETYPILIQEFDNPLIYRPTKNQVPDSKYTGEHWILESVIPDRCSFIWLTANSILWEEIYEFPMTYACKRLYYTDIPAPGMNHPWINGLGHVLDSDEGEETYLTT